MLQGDVAADGAEVGAPPRPELYHAFVGIGQMVGQPETDIMFWEDALARTEGNSELAETLRRNGPPPRRDVPRLEVPFYMVLGEHEARGRAALAEDWFEMVDAPLKERIIFDGAVTGRTSTCPASSPK